MNMSGPTSRRDGSNAKGFLAEIVYNWRFCPHHFFPPKEISEFAVASIKGRDDERRAPGDPAAGQEFDQIPRVQDLR